MNKKELRCGIPTWRSVFRGVACGALVACVAGGVAAAADALPHLGSPTLLADGELRMRLTTAAAGYCRVDSSEDLTAWTALVTLGTSSRGVQVTDSAAPRLAARFYRAEQLDGTDVFTGDHLATSEGDVVFHPVYHASLVLSWNGRTIYIDPADVAARFNLLPRADLVLLTHEHSDHYTPATVTAVAGANAVIVAPPSIKGTMPTAMQAVTTELANGAAANLLGIGIEAIPAYNLTSAFHPKGSGNGYVLTLGGRRVYVSGDTEDIPEMRALRNVDVAFVCMNLPYTMTVEKAVSAVREFHPRIVYPYHYSTGSNATRFKTQMAVEPGVEVRLRTWY